MYHCWSSLRRRYFLFKKRELCSLAMSAVRVFLFSFMARHACGKDPSDILTTKQVEPLRDEVLQPED